MNKWRKTDKVTKPHVELEDNLILTVKLPPDMYYVAEALEIVLPSVLHKFAVHIHKGDWLTNGLSIKEACEHLHSEVNELEQALKEQKPEDVLMEAADVINQSMILATLFKSNVAPKKIPIIWKGREFIARSDGEIEFATGLKKGQPVKFSETWKGYYETVMYGVNTKKGYSRMSRRRVILEAFKGPPPSSGHHADHINGLVWDDRPDNLQWLDGKENSSQSGKQNKHIPHQQPHRKGRVT